MLTHKKPSSKDDGHYRNEISAPVNSWRIKKQHGQLQKNAMRKNGIQIPELNSHAAKKCCHARLKCGRLIK